MDNATLGSVVYLFAFALPLSVFFWVVALLAATQSSDPDRHSRVFRFVASAGFLPASRAGRLIFAVAGLVFANSVPVLSLTKDAYKSLTGWILGFLLVQGICVAVLALDVLRSRRDRVG